MPQKKKRRTAEEILGIAPRPRRSAEEILGIAPQQPPTPAPAPTEDANSLLENAMEAAMSGGRYLYSGVSNVADAVGSFLAGGDPTKMGNLAETVGRGGLKVVDSISAAQTGNPATAEIQTPAIQRLAQERVQRSPELQALERREREYDEFTKRNPSKTAKAVRGISKLGVEAVPTVVAGVASGGSIPAIAGATALSSMGAPESLPLNVALAALPAPAVAPILQRIRGGKTAATEAAETGAATAVRETAPFPPAGEIQGPGRPTNPTLENQITEQLAPTAPPNVERAMSQFTKAVNDIHASNLTPAEKAAALDMAIQTIGQEATGVPPVAANAAVRTVADASRRGYPPLMTMPETPNAIQVAGELPPIPPGASVMQAEPQAAMRAPNNQGLARAIGNSADDTGKVTTAELGLESKFPPSRPANAQPVRQTVNIDDITLGRDDLSRGRMFQVEQALQGGVKPPLKGVPRAQQIDPIEVVPDPQNPGRYIVENDGNHRTALLKLQGYSGDVPVTVWETPAYKPFSTVQLGEGELVRPRYGVRAGKELPYTESVGPSLGEAAMNVGAGPTPAIGATPATSGPSAFLNNAIDEAAAGVPVSTVRGITNPVQAALFETAPRKSMLRRVGEGALEAYRFQRALLSSGDISAPFRQGALLTYQPTQWGKAAKAGIRMFRAFKTKNYENITREIALHPDAPLANNVGLYLSTQVKEGVKKTEEAFISRLAERTPILKQSEQAYKTYLDSLRMDTFARYKAAIDKAGLAPKEAERAYAAAADWINVATGRGSFGTTIDKALPVLTEVLWSPRYLASRLNVLNPVMYARNAATPGGRVVLQEQMKDLVQFAGMVAGTYQLAKAAGAEVGLDWRKPDFLRIKVGNWRYDPLAGLQGVMRLAFRTAEGLAGVAQGEKPKRGDSVPETLLSFLRGKLAPAPSFFVDWLTQRTYTGQPFDVSKAVIERVAPMQWYQWLESYMREGFQGAAMATPGALGIGAQYYEPMPGAVNIQPELDEELLKRGLNYASIEKLPGDTDETQKTRAQKVEQWLNYYTPQLIASPRFGQLTPSQQTEAIKKLHGRITGQANLKQPNVSGFNPLAVVGSVLSAERRAPARNLRKIVAEPE